MAFMVLLKHVFMVILFVCYVIAEPYADKHDQFLAETCQYSIFFVFFGALLVSANIVGEASPCSTL